MHNVLDTHVLHMHIRGMNLSTYLDRNGISDTAFAVAVGISRSMVTRLRHRQTKPSADTALRIELATQGNVMLADLIDAPEGAEAPSDGAAA